MPARAHRVPAADCPPRPPPRSERDTLQGPSSQHTRVTPTPPRRLPGEPRPPPYPGGRAGPGTPARGTRADPPASGPRQSDPRAARLRHLTADGADQAPPALRAEDSRLLAPNTRCPPAAPRSAPRRNQVPRPATRRLASVPAVGPAAASPVARHPPAGHPQRPAPGRPPRRPRLRDRRRARQHPRRPRRPTGRPSPPLPLGGRGGRG